MRGEMLSNSLLNLHYKKRYSLISQVFGYTVAHDVSARDWQLKRNGGQWLVGKTMDAFCPIGTASQLSLFLALREVVRGIT